MIEVWHSGDVTLYLGDCLEVLPTLEAGSVDAVVTDPPYQKKYSYLWEPLASESARLLPHGHSLVTLLGHYQLPLVMDVMRKHLTYWWIGGMYHPARRSVMFFKKVTVWWKPALWFVKDTTRRLPDIPMDMIKPDDTMDKSLHRWQQPLSWFSHWVTRLTYSGELVLDPFKIGRAHV